MADPLIELHAPDRSVLSNDNWQGTQPAEIEATGIAPSTFESALIAILMPGAYTAILRDAQGATGIRLLEVYDVDETAAAAVTSNDVWATASVPNSDIRWSAEWNG